MQLAHQTIRTWIATVPPGLTVTDLLDPGFFSLHADRLNINDLVRVVAADHAFDTMLTVRSKAANRIVMELWPKLPAAIGTARAA
jgi:hypothetical protein